jgi:hypothetical protein
VSSAAELVGARKNPAGKAAEATLKETGLIYISSGLDEVHVSNDGRFSLRYSDDDHIARELGPLHQAAPCPARAAEAGPDTRERAPRPGRRPPSGPAQAQSAGPCPSWAEAHTGPAITTDARPVPQAATMNAAPGPASRNGPETSMAARTSRRTCRCLDGAAPPAVMPA